MEPVAILYNQKAGRHRSRSIALGLEKELGRRGISCEVFGENWPPALRTYSMGWVVGGDGTMNHLLNHCEGELPPLALFRGGTGNDLANLLYGDLSFPDQVECILRAVPRPVDAGLCNGKYFLNMCGLGFDGEVLESMDTIRWMGPVLGYYTAIVKHILLFREPHYRLWINGVEQAEAEFLILMASNAPTTGGGFRVSPKARIDDGNLDLITIGRLKVWDRLRYLPRVRRGDHLGLPFVQHREFQCLRVSSAQTLRAQLDGELIMDKEFNISILPGKFSFLY